MVQRQKKGSSLDKKYASRKKRHEVTAAISPEKKILEGERTGIGEQEERPHQGAGLKEGLALEKKDASQSQPEARQAAQSHLLEGLPKKMGKRGKKQGKGTAARRGSISKRGGIYKVHSKKRALAGMGDEYW